MAAYTLRRVAPKFRMAAQAAGWQEARLSAEAGVDLAVEALQQNAAGAAPGAWSGWTQSQTGGVGNPPAGNPLIVNSLLGNTISQTMTIVNSLVGLLGNIVTVSSPTPVTMSPPLVLNTAQKLGAGAQPSSLDLKLWAVYPTSSPYYRWFRIRAMATCPLPRPCYQSPEDLDISLRRYSLHAIRPQLQAENVGAAALVPTPSASRIVEVLLEPVLPFELAIMTNQSLSLATSGAWNVDSFDSRDPRKSNLDGTYPGKGSPLVQSNGNIASDLGRPADMLYGPLISVNGCNVSGGIATNGGDDPSTAAHENVTGANGVDPTRVRSDFFREMPVFARPSSGIFLAPPPKGAPFLAGTMAQPTVYLVPSDLSGFSVAPPLLGMNGSVVIMVDGNLDVPTGTITIPPNVSAVIFVRGNIDFHGQAINTGPGSSRRAAQLQIYGEASNGDTRTLQAYGNASICAAFYGPDYDVTLQDNVEWVGAVAGKSFQMIGGGNGGFHYDEALGVVGAPIGFRIARYVEDVRE
jgi:hypothetical protein